MPWNEILSSSRKASASMPSWNVMATKTDALKPCFNLRRPDGFICPNCSHDKSCPLNTCKLRHCYRCHRQHHLQTQQIANDNLVPGDLPADADQERHLGDATASAIGHFLQRNLADETQTDAGDTQAR